VTVCAIVNEVLEDPILLLIFMSRARCKPGRRGGVGFCPSQFGGCRVVRCGEVVCQRGNTLLQQVVEPCTPCEQTRHSDMTESCAPPILPSPDVSLDPSQLAQTPL